jgi:hypothetical protein
MGGKCKNCVVGLLGSCGEDYCASEREILVAQAQRVAEAHGHHLGAFVKLADVPVWRARCAGCGREVAVNLDPQPGELVVSAASLLEDCPADAAREVSVEAAEGQEAG